MDGRDLMIRGVDGIDEGLPGGLSPTSAPCRSSDRVDSRSSYAGGDAGLFSAVLGGWVGGPKGSEPDHPPDLRT